MRLLSDIDQALRTFDNMGGSKYGTSLTMGTDGAINFMIDPDDNNSPLLRNSSKPCDLGSPLSNSLSHPPPLTDVTNLIPVVEQSSLSQHATWKRMICQKGISNPSLSVSVGAKHHLYSPNDHCKLPSKKTFGFS